MGAIGGMIGAKGGVNGTGAAGPTGTAIYGNGASEGTANAATQNTLGTAQQQQDLLSALQQQNALSGQVQATNYQAALAGRLANNNSTANQNNQYANAAGLQNQLAAQNGVGSESAALAGIAGPGGVASQYQNIASGIGPNPAQAALNQSTGQNVTNQAALMAGQRGAGANVGLMARQAAQQGAATQQQAVGQAATMQAQQQLAGLQGLQGAQTSAAGIAAQQVGQQQQQQQIAAAQAQQQMANQMASYQALAGQTNVMAGQQLNQTNAVNQSAQQEQNIQQQGINAQNQANVSMQSSINGANAGLASAGMQQQSGLIGGVLGGAGAAIGLGKAEGGLIKSPKKMAEGGETAEQAPIQQPASATAVPSIAVPPVQQNGPASSFGKFLQGYGGSNGQSGNPLQQGMTQLGAGIGILFKHKSETPAATPVPAAEPAAPISSVGPDDAGDSNSESMMAARGGRAHHDFRTGGHVAATTPKEKAVKSGNSYANDKIPAVLSEGEVVIPRSVMQSKDPIASSAKFVRDVLAKKKRKSA